MDANLQQDMVDRFRNGEGCDDCGGIHRRTCPRVKRKCFHPNGNVIEVEYWPDGSYDASNVLWPEDLFTED